MTENKLPSSAPRTLHQVDLSRDEYDADNEAREVVADLTEANVVSSIARRPDSTPPRHFPVLDIDIPAFLVPSSTPGHSHLYIDHEVSDEVYWRLCDVLAEAGILQPGYVGASKSRGYTSVRLPWVKKSAPEEKTA